MFNQKEKEISVLEEKGSSSPREAWAGSSSPREASVPGGTNFFWLPSPSRINLEEP
jgi:hypothetical protein